MITADFKNKKRAYGRFNCIFQIILCFLDLLSYSLRLLYTCLVHYCILVFHSHLWYGINLQDSNLLRWKKIMIFVPASLWQSAVAILPMGRGGDHGQSLLLWRPSGPVHSSKMSLPDMISNESEIYTEQVNKTPDSNVQNEINVQSIPARRSEWWWRWWQWWWWRLITQFCKTYSHFTPKKPSDAIVSFMKVCKRTPLSKIPRTFHRRVGRGNGERGVERKRREGGRRDYIKYLELCKIPLKLDPEKMDNREERDSGLFPN